MSSRERHSDLIISQLYSWLLMSDQLLEITSTDTEFRLVADQKSQLNHGEDCLAGRCARQRVESKTQLLRSLYIDHMKHPGLELANVIYHFISFQNNYILLMSKIKSSWLTERNLHSQRTLLSELDEIYYQINILLTKLSLSSQLVQTSTTPTILSGLESLLARERDNLGLMKGILINKRNIERIAQEIDISKMSILGEPYLLSSYTPPLRSIFKKHAVHEVTCNEYDQKCLATVSVQGDGVHVLEISAMRPVISHTLGPDTRFTCPSILQVHESGTSSIYAITEQPGTNSESSKYDLLKWTDSLSNNSMQVLEQKSSLNFTENIHRIYSPLKMSSKLIALSVSGHVYILSTENLNIDQVFQHTVGNSVLLRSFNFSPESCSFASQLINSDGTLILRFILTNKTLFLKISFFSHLGLKEVSVCHLCDDEEIVDLTCSPSGYITVLTARGIWRIFRLDERGHLMKEASSTLNLNMPRSRGFTLASITSSFVLIACIEGSSNLHLALWDIRYSVVLATQQFTLPSNLITGLKTAPQIKLVVATQTEVLVLVSPPTDSETLSSSRSAIFVLPVNIPTSSSITLAMGKAPDAPVWLLDRKGPPIREEGRRQDLLNRIQNAINNGSPHEADNIFFTWVEEETERAKAKEKAVADPPNNPTQGAVNKITRRPAIPKLSYRFVAMLLDTVLQPSKTSGVPYSSKIPLYLVQRKAVSDNMISGGFISVLRRRDDWESIHATLQNMGDIPEEQVINLLIEVLKNHKRFLRTTDEDMMEIEPKSTLIPSLASFLPVVLQYQMSSTAACYALKISLTDVDDILLILKELGQILEQSCGQDPIDSTVDSLPSSQTVLSFMQLILDAHFLTLLQHPPARSLLRQISDHLQANILVVEDLNRLRGPLNSVLQAQGSASRNFGQREDKKDRRKDTFNTIVGLYQVEELIL